MNNISEKISTANREGIQMLEDLAKNVYGGFEEMVWLNLAASKASVVESCRRAQTLLSAKGAQEWLTMQIEVLRLPTEDYAAHTQRMFDVVFGVHSEFAKCMDTMLASFNKAVNAGQIGIDASRRSARKIVEVEKIN